MGDDRRNETATLIIGLVLVAVGVSALLNLPFVPWLEPVRAVLRTGRQVAGPLTLIVIGLAVLFYAQRGGFRAPERGKRLYRSREKKMVAGVLGGLSDYFGVEVTLLRLVTVALALFSPWPWALAYLIGAVVIPLEPAEGEAPPPPAPPQG